MQMHMTLTGSCLSFKGCEFCSELGIVPLSKVLSCFSKISSCMKGFYVYKMQSM
uniref:Uncharacterized protein n=1 Tax=Anguilla anguilla TaxID=7936 RepID=A0A0E9VRQ5_ANGAN